MWAPEGPRTNREAINTGRAFFFIPLYLGIGCLSASFSAPPTQVDFAPPEVQT